MWAKKYWRLSYWRQTYWPPQSGPPPAPPPPTTPAAGYWIQGEWSGGYWAKSYWPKIYIAVPFPPPPGPVIVGPQAPPPSPFTLPLTYDWSQILPASKFMSRVGYNANQSLLLVQFNNGTFMLLSGVVADIAEAFRASSSPDYFFGNSILGKYTVVQQTSL